jgi:3-oxoadipate enol-lactonase
LLKAWLSDAFKASRPARWQQIHDTLTATTVAGFEGCVAAMSDFDYTASLGALRVPVLVVYGADDPMTPPAENQRLAAAIPGARHEAIAGAKHFANVEQAEAFNRILLDWLAANR